MIGTIRLCQRLLKRPVTSDSELLALSLADLEQLALQLEGELPQEPRE